MPDDTYPEGLDGQWQHVDDAESPRRRLRLFSLQNNSRWLLIAVLPALFATVGVFEARTSEIEARIFSAAASRLSYAMGQGPSPSIAFPSGGPYNESRGYAGLPGFEHRLMGAGFRIVAQARLSPELQRLTQWRITPPFREPAAAGLNIQGESGAVIRPLGEAVTAFPPGPSAARELSRSTSATATSVSSRRTFPVIRQRITCSPARFPSQP